MEDNLWEFYNPPKKEIKWDTKHRLHNFLSLKPVSFHDFESFGTLNYFIGVDYETMQLDKSFQSDITIFKYKNRGSHEARIVSSYVHAYIHSMEENDITGISLLCSRNSYGFAFDIARDTSKKFLKNNMHLKKNNFSPLEILIFDADQSDAADHKLSKSDALLRYDFKNLCDIKEGYEVLIAKPRIEFCQNFLPPAIMFAIAIGGTIYTFF